MPHLFLVNAGHQKMSHSFLTTLPSPYKLTLMSSHSVPPLVNTKHCHRLSFGTSDGTLTLATNFRPSPLTLISKASKSDTSNSFGSEDPNKVLV